MTQEEVSFGIIPKKQIAGMEDTGKKFKDYKAHAMKILDESNLDI